MELECNENFQSFNYINKLHTTVYNVIRNFIIEVQSPTSLGCSPCSLNLRGVLLRAYLHPLKYMLQEHPKENEAPQVSGSFPWHAQVRLHKTKLHFRTQSQDGGPQNSRVSFFCLIMRTLFCDVYNDYYYHPNF